MSATVATVPWRQREPVPWFAPSLRPFQLYRRGVRVLRRQDSCVRSSTISLRSHPRFLFKFDLSRNGFQGDSVNFVALQLPNGGQHPLVPLGKVSTLAHASLLCQCLLAFIGSNRTREELNTTLHCTPARSVIAKERINVSAVCTTMRTNCCWASVARTVIITSENRDYLWKGCCHAITMPKRLRIRNRIRTLSSDCL